MSTIVWLRQDLRMADNPALSHACRHGAVLPVFILDDVTPAPYRRLGAASRWWLHHSLAALETGLGGLHLLSGDPLVLLPDLAKQIGADRVTWNRCYDPGSIARDRQIKLILDHALAEQFRCGSLGHGEVHPE
jgi:deoxyribodipyrimidine photo-lyase